MLSPARVPGRMGGTASRGVDLLMQIDYAVSRS